MSKKPEPSPYEPVMRGLSEENRERLQRALDLAPTVLSSTGVNTSTDAHDAAVVAVMGKDEERLERSHYKVLNESYDWITLEDGSRFCASDAAGEIACLRERAGYWLGIALGLKLSRVLEGGPR